MKAPEPTINSTRSVAMQWRFSPKLELIPLPPRRDRARKRQKSDQNAPKPPNEARNAPNRNQREPQGTRSTPRGLWGCSGAFRHVTTQSDASPLRSGSKPSKTRPKRTQTRLEAHERTADAPPRRAAHSKQSLAPVPDFKDPVPDFKELQLGPGPEGDSIYPNFCVPGLRSLVRFYRA